MNKANKRSDLDMVIRRHSSTCAIYTDAPDHMARQCDCGANEAKEELSAMRAKIAFLENTLDFHKRAKKLMVKRKNFVVVAFDEPYFIATYDQIKLNEVLKGTWTVQDERNYQEAVSSASSI
jgi:hypothetical protein